ncbi:zinc finger CCCH domain-containing protein 56-like isoform X2 [Musa acuminata AAA Group]|uniref:zinc finger CCCH domain-containing protein 56-like isoform X2 n=1 Tax=Musa acuminata AAA Group TaxID=214697 RepID=UPI0031D0DD94
MDYGGGAAYPGSNAIAIIPDASGPPDSWPPGGNDQPMWATDEDYRSWSGDPSADAASNSAYDGRLSRSRAGSEQPPGKKGRNSQADAQGGNRTTTSKAIGKMFFKTKLCCKFRAGTCPYITNCNFAHGIEELRRPPPNWQEIVAAQEEGSSEPREERRIPTMNSSVVAGESERSYKGRRCKKFYTEEGCPYGDSCTFIHDEQSKARESVTISLSPMVGGSGLGGGANTPTQKPSNWKTRTCHKWEMTGYCPFGNKCHFAHGAAGMVGVLWKQKVEMPPWLFQTLSMVGCTQSSPHRMLPLLQTVQFLMLICIISASLLRGPLVSYRGRGRGQLENGRGLTKLVRYMVTGLMT